MSTVEQRDAMREASRDLFEALLSGEGIRVEGNSWYFASETDRDEPEHRCDSIAGQLFCTCRGFIAHKHCKHSDRRRKMEETTMTREVATVGSQLPAMARQNPAALAVRLADMVENRRLTKQFFQEVMEEGTDYGVIPGTDKPTLFKPGAEGLCEFYGFAPTYTIEETKDLSSGFLRVVVTCTLIQRGTGDIVAQGVGECNTREARYYYRWMSEAALKRIPELYQLRESFKKEQRSGRGKDGRQWSSTYYRVENDDLFTLWNTVLKMAKKRAHVDATLSATRSSGLFSQGQAALEDWIEGEIVSKDDEPGVDRETGEIKEREVPAGASGGAPKDARPAASNGSETPPSLASTDEQVAQIEKLVADIKGSWGAASQDFIDLQRKLVADYGAEKLKHLASLTGDEAAAIITYLRERNGEPPVT